MSDYVIRLRELGIGDVPRVGGKNASLGEMIQHLTQLGVQVPGGFATTADAYREFLARDGLDEKIQAQLDTLDVDDVNRLAEVGARIRGWIMEQPFQPELEAAIDTAFGQLVDEAGSAELSWAVRSSATAEDLPDASFAGQQETFLNVSGLDNIKQTLCPVADQINFLTGFTTITTTDYGRLITGRQQTSGNIDSHRRFAGAAHSQIADTNHRYG